MSSQVWWYSARASGLVAWVVLGASVVWGLLLSGRALGRKRGPRPNWMLDLHRFLGGLGVSFVAVHVASVIADSYVHFDATDVLVPGASSWKTMATAWGVVSMYLLVAVELTSLFRTRIPKRWWKAVHLSSYPLFATATVHGLTAGTDTAPGSPAGTASIAVAALVAAGIVGLTVHRVLSAMSSEPDPPARARIPARATRATRTAPASAPVPTHGEWF